MRLTLLLSIIFYGACSAQKVDLTLDKVIIDREYDFDNGRRITLVSFIISHNSEKAIPETSYYVSLKLNNKLYDLCDSEFKVDIREAMHDSSRIQLYSYDQDVFINQVLISEDSVLNFIKEFDIIVYSAKKSIVLEKSKNLEIFYVNAKDQGILIKYDFKLSKIVRKEIIYNPLLPHD